MILHKKLTKQSTKGHVTSMVEVTNALMR